jgi:FkbM family methyltransferase
MNVASIRVRFQRVASFMGAGRLPRQWVSLALLGWARGNPSSTLSRRYPTVTLRPAALREGVLIVSTRDLGQLVSFEEIFVERAYDLSRVPFTPTHVVDCGGHVGFFSALAGAAYPHVPIVIFEPNPDNVPWLRRNLAALGNRLTVHVAAVSTYDGTSRFTAEVSNGGHLDKSESAGVEVPVMNLANCLPAGDDVALLLKMDIEGEEKRLLPHVLPALPHRCAIFLETHDGLTVHEHLTARLMDAGFRVTALRERGEYADVLALRDVV